MNTICDENGRPLPDLPDPPTYQSGTPRGDLPVHTLEYCRDEEMWFDPPAHRGMRDAAVLAEHLKATRLTVRGDVPVAICEAIRLRIEEILQIVLRGRESYAVPESDVADVKKTGTGELDYHDHYLVLYGELIALGHVLDSIESVLGTGPRSERRERDARIRDQHEEEEVA